MERQIEKKIHRANPFRHQLLFTNEYKQYNFLKGALRKKHITLAYFQQGLTWIFRKYKTSQNWARMYANKTQQSVQNLNLGTVFKDASEKG